MISHEYRIRLRAVASGSLRLHPRVVCHAPIQGTGQPSLFAAAEGGRRVAAPAWLSADGTGVPTQGPALLKREHAKAGSGKPGMAMWGMRAASQGLGQRPADLRQRTTSTLFALTTFALALSATTTNRILATRNVVVDDTPGVRTWSPPV